MTWILLVLAGIQPSWAEPARTILIDGDLSDWEDIPGYSDPSEDITKPGTDILEFKIAHDETHLYYYSRHAGPIVSEDAGTGGQGRYYYLLFIDLDNNPLTGFNPATTDPECYDPVSLGCDLEFEFERDWNDAQTLYVYQYFYGYGGPRSLFLNQSDLLQGLIRFGPADYDNKAQFKFLTESIPSGIVFTDDIRRSGYTPGTDVFMTQEFSPDMTECEIGVDFRAALKDSMGNPHLHIGKTISVGLACESSPWADCGDGMTPVFNYVLEGAQEPIECAQSADLVIDCSGVVASETRTLRLKLLAGSAPLECTSTLCAGATLVDITLDCASPEPETPFDCATLTGVLVSQVLDAVQTQGGGTLAATIQSLPPGTVRIVSSVPFHACLCGEELGLPCAGGIGWPLSTCAVSNLCDGVDGNEDTLLGFTGGLSLTLLDVACPPTPTPSETETPIPPTPTATSSPSESPTETPLEPTSTPMPTETELEPTPTMTSTPIPGDLNADEVVDFFDLFAFSKEWKKSEDSGDPRADLHDDPEIDSKDLLLFQMILLSQGQ
ncbi:MAG: hypothetical protein HUU16_18855 [Candidatus Omnitrophica bacterium]|nr:hypothetical protein [Candidatus Omnitrophota bacterium]